MNRIVVKSLLAAGVFLAVFVIMQILCLCTMNTIKNVLPNAACVYSPTGTGISMGQAQSFREFPGGAVGALSAPVLCEIEVPIRDIIKVTNASYATPEISCCICLQFVYGGWFLRGEEQNITAQAVIPEALSIALFGTSEPSNLSFYIGRQKYLIAGVYRDNDGFLSKISGDRVPGVYLLDNLRVANLPVTALYLGDSKGNVPEYMLQQASGFQDVALHGSIIDYPGQIELLQGTWYISIGICYFFLLALLIISAERLFAAALFGQDTGKRFRYAVIGLCVTIGALGLLFILFSRLHIPNAYLPAGSIFDVSFYKRAIISFFRNLDAVGEMNLYFEKVFLSHTLALVFLAINSVVFFYMGIFKLWKTLDRGGLQL